MLAVLSFDPANEMKVLQIMAMRKCCVLAAQHRHEVSSHNYYKHGYWLVAKTCG